MKITDYLKDHIVYLDGGMGTLLQKRGLKPGELPETWNLSHPEIISGLHRNYYDAGTNIVYANTFGANALLDGRAQIEPTVNLAVLLVVIEAAGIVLGIVLQVLLEPATRLLLDGGVVDTDDVVDVLVTGVRKRFRASRIVQFCNGILPVLFGLLYGVLLILFGLFVAVDQFLVVFIDYRARSHCYRSNTAGNE